MIKVFNTLSGKKESLPKQGKGGLKMFVCGPTVYDYPHIGNARTFTAFDIIVRYLRSKKVNLFYLQNITDIDDKIIGRADKEKTSWKKIAGLYEKIYYENLRALNISSVNEYAKATDYIPQIIKQVKTLIKKGNAYKITGDGWYFNLKTFPDYGKLSRRTVEQAGDAVSRIDSGSKKKNPGDFCLWKFSPPEAGQPRAGNEPSWESEIGKGRPGWHIEDTAISEHFFGTQYDIHGGAIDLKFPHHEAEIAQQESASGKKPFVKIWMHSGFLEVNGEKMSKSLNNFITIADFLKRHSGDAFRMLVANHHYSSPMNYTEETAKTAEKNLQEIKEFLAKLELIETKKSSAKLPIKELKKKFYSAMDDDFNSPKALGAIFEFMNETNKKIWEVNKKQAAEAGALIKTALKSLGFEDLALKIPAEITAKARKRELYRINKQFIQADALRKETEALGYSIEDTPAGPLVLKK